MKDPRKIKDEYFNIFRTTPVEIKPFDPNSKILAYKYINKLKEILKNYDLKIVHIGSTALEIIGKGEIEIAIYPNKKDWHILLIDLINYYKSIGNLEKDYARFNDNFKGEEIEVIIMTGQYAKLDMKVFEYLKTHTEVLKEYEELKRKYSYSKREYKLQQHKFFQKIINLLPEDLPLDR